MSAAVIGSAIVCCVYGSLVYSMIRLRVLKTRQQRAYVSPVPLWLNWILVPVLPLLGLASLLITPEVGAGAWIGFGLCALVSYCMTLWFTSRKEKSVSVLAGSN
jgi:ethanolamine permease